MMSHSGFSAIWPRHGKPVSVPHETRAMFSVGTVPLAAGAA
jgi:hypothetical protein